jgi:hypothetical protein
MRYRKNISCLSTEELHDLREALAAMYTLPASDPNSFARIASFHGGPPTGYCRHGAPGFFTWHRAYLMAFENALRSIRCDVTVPYWDWSSGPSTGVPQACRLPTYVDRAGTTKPNPLYSGPRAAGGQTNRAAGIDSAVFDGHAAQAQTDMAETNFASFQSLISGVHGWVHGTVGGDMGSVPVASYDPIFYLHHANVDRIWAGWQAAHAAALPTNEATFDLQPFNRPFSTQWQRGADVESLSALGYQYRRFCLYFPPFRFWEVLNIRWPFSVREQMTAARLVIKSEKMPEAPLEIRAFINQPDASGRTKTLGNPAFAGAVGFMGHGARRMDVCPECGAKLDQAHEKLDVCSECGAKLNLPGAHTHSDEDGHVHDEHSERTAPERLDVELDVTAAVRAADREEEITLKLIAVDISGNEVSTNDVPVEDVEIVLR